MIVKTGRNILMCIVLLTSILITTIVYSAFSTQLQISGEAIVRSDNDIRITNIKILNQTNNAYETYNNKYTKDTTSMFVTLPSNSSITYEVEITNKVDTGYIIGSINEISNTNSNININIELNQYDLVSSNSIKKFNISFTNATNDEQTSSLVLKYIFLENRFIVTFDYNSGYDINNKVFNFDGITQTIAGTINDATWDADGLVFDGKNSWVNLGQINYNYMMLDVTFSINQFTSTNQSIISNMDTGGGNIGIHYSTGNTIYGQFYINGSYRSIISRVQPIIGNIYNVILTYDGSAIKMFINDELIDSIYITGSIKIPNYSTVMALGTNPMGNGLDYPDYQYMFNGKIYSAKIFKNEIVTKEVAYGSSYGELPIPTKDGYTFKGWNTKENGTGIYITEYSKVMIAGNHRLYAIWEEN